MAQEQARIHSGEPRGADTQQIQLGGAGARRGRAMVAHRWFEFILNGQQMNGHEMALTHVRSLASVPYNVCVDYANYTAT